MFFFRAKANKYQYFSLTLCQIIQDAHKLLVKTENYENDLAVSYETEFVGDSNFVSNIKKEKKVIIVDDDVLNLQVAGKALSMSGIHVIALKSGQALLDYFDTPGTNADLILLDIKMPEMDGFETLSKLRKKDCEASQVPVLFLTSVTDKEKILECLSLNPQGYLIKPISRSELLQRVAEVINPAANKA